EAQATVQSWELRGCIPMKYTGHTITGKGGGDVAMEEIALSAVALEINARHRTQHRHGPGVRNRLAAAAVRTGARRRGLLHRLRCAPPRTALAHGRARATARRGLGRWPLAQGR